LNHLILAGSYTGNTYDSNANEGQASAISVSPDGTKFYIAGINSNRVWQYEMSTPFDLSTASFTSGDNFSFASELTTPRNVQFNSDGTTMYLSQGGSGENFEYQYELSTAWDVKSAAYTGNSLDVGSEVNLMFSSFLSASGNNYYVANFPDPIIYQYSLSVAEDITSASYDGISVNFSSEISGNIRSFFLNDVGEKLYVADSSTGIIHQYNLSTAFDISTATYSNEFFETDPPKRAGRFHIDFSEGKVYTLRSQIVYEFSDFNFQKYTTDESWVAATTNDELSALEEATDEVVVNRMDAAQLNAVSDANHYTLGDDLDLAITFFMADGNTNSPTSDGVAVNYDANVLNQGAVLGTDYEFDKPTNTTVRVTALSDENLKVRVL